MKQTVKEMQSMQRSHHAPVAGPASAPRRAGVTVRSGAALVLALVLSTVSAGVGQAGDHGDGEAATAMQGKDAKASEMKGEKKDGALPIGATIPSADVAMLGVDGEEHTIDGTRGERGTLVIFSCNACPWVKAWEERIAAIGNATMKRDVGVIMINSNDPGRVAEDSYEVMQKRTEQRGFGFPYVVDATSDVARAFGATRTPEFFLFDAGGELVYHGALDDNAQAPEKVEERYLEVAIDAMLSGDEIAVDQTKALGCTIKFRKEA
jgi:hypothetical protein